MRLLYLMMQDQLTLLFSVHQLNELFRPPDWLLKYICPPELLRMLVEKRDRRSFYFRDRKGHLCCYLRNGFIDWKNIYRKLKGDVDILLGSGVWSLELLRADIDALHIETNGKTPSYVTLVVDLQDFAINRQIPINYAIPLAKLYFRIIATSYPELLHKVIMINAPWLFHGVFKLFKPFLPPELLNKVAITGHKEALKALEDHIEPQNIPKYLGGLAEEDGDEFCKNRIAPYAPFTADKGKSLLKTEQSPTEQKVKKL